jgi:hypothetical protein
MKHGLQQGRRVAPLVVGCGVAITVHVLGLSLLTGRRAGQSRPAPLDSRDNTPELLQWSSQPAPLPNLEVLPLPKSAVLPPPPDRLVPGKRASGAGGPVRRARGQGAGGALLAPTPRSDEDRRGRQGATNRSAKPQAAGPRDGGGNPGDWVVALGQLEAVQERDAPRADSGKDSVAEAAAADEGSGRPPMRLALDPSERDAYQTLWRQARPHRLPALPPTASGTRGAAEVRQVSLGQVRAAAVPIRHGEGVVLPGEVLLVWLQGEKIFLLRSTGPSRPSR